MAQISRYLLCIENSITTILNGPLNKNLTHVCKHFETLEYMENVSSKI